MITETQNLAEVTPRLRKKSRQPQAGLVQLAAPRPPTAPTNLGGALPGDDDPGLFWETRIAAWLGLPRSRVANLRRGALHEGEHWLVHDQQVVYSLAGIQRLRDLLQARGERLAGKNPAQKAATPVEPRPPAGPVETVKLRILRLCPNPRLMMAVRPQEPEKAMLVRVRDNSNFIAGMMVPAAWDARAGNWQFTGRLPRQKGRF